jgi:chorismate mutase
MTEPVMYFGIGFLVAALLGLLVVVRVHNREHIGSVDQFRADVRELEEQLAIALSERSKLQREIVAMKRDAELTWAAERIESALFRERINDVAYEVMRIIQALESPSSSIEPISVYATLVIGRGRRTQTPDIDSTSGDATAPTIHTGALADRIRALRTTASRAAAN